MEHDHHAVATVVAKRTPQVARWRRRDFVKGFGALAGSAGLLGYDLGLAAAERSRSASFPAPDFTLPTLSAASIRLSDLRGKVVVLNFWVTWCGPCRAEMPTLDALYQRYKERGLEVLAVNLDAVSTSSVQAFVREVGVTFRVGLDPSSSTARTYRVLSLPTTYLIDRAGNVVVQEVGGRDWLDDVSQLAVEGLLQ
jgi:peroxiredoxin